MGTGEKKTTQTINATDKARLKYLNGVFPFGENKSLLAGLKTIF